MRVGSWRQSAAQVLVSCVAVVNFSLRDLACAPHLRGSLEAILWRAKVVFVSIRHNAYPIWRAFATFLSMYRVPTAQLTLT